MTAQGEDPRSGAEAEGLQPDGEADAPNPAPADQTSIAPGSSDGGEGIE